MATENSINPPPLSPSLPLYPEVNTEFSSIFLGLTFQENFVFLLRVLLDLSWIFIDFVVFLSDDYDSHRVPERQERV